MCNYVVKYMWKFASMHTPLQHSGSLAKSVDINVVNNTQFLAKADHFAL